jgi:hypothetical protein
MKIEGIEGGLRMMLLDGCNGKRYDEQKGRDKQKKSKKRRGLLTVSFLETLDHQSKTRSRRE